jgi:CheY-like chemotaxis protein
MGIIDSVKRWRSSWQGRDGTPAAPQPAVPRPAVPRPAVPQPSQPQPIARQTAPSPAARSEPPVPAPTHEVQIHDDADVGLLESALADDHYQGPERRGRPRASARSGTKVLIVDDSPTIVTVLRKMLQQNGYRTIEAYSAEQAMELVQHEIPDLIFLDIVLPGMDGFSALRALRKDPNTKPVPIIMISGNAQATEQFYVQRIGADDFMKKPFTRAEVFDRIERLLDADHVPRRAVTLSTTASS